MEATATQGITFMQLRYFWPLELNNITHSLSTKNHSYFLAITFHAASHVCGK